MIHRKLWLLAVLVALMPVAAWADWDVGDPHKMHFPQLPDPFGWDVNFGPPHRVLADDWLCTGTGPVTDIHFWVSIHGDNGVVPQFPAITAIRAMIYADKPASGFEHSQPLTPAEMPLWQHVFLPGQFTVRAPQSGLQGWLDPAPPMIVIPNDHVYFYQINIKDIVDPFIQQQGTIYWLGLHVDVDPLSSQQIGWKTSLQHFNDDGVFWDDVGGLGMAWHELRDPLTTESLDLAFVITPEPSTWAMLVGALAIAMWTGARKWRR